MKLALAPLVLLAGLSLAACGSDDADDTAASGTSAASEASTAAESADTGPFCDAITATATLQDGADVAALRDDLEDSGIPEEAGADAEAGLEVFIGILDEVDEDATAQELATMEDPQLSDEEQGQVDAMVTYATETCAGGAGESPEAPESPSPSE